MATRTGKPTFELENICSGELLSSLIHKIGHEIGNPLTAIISLASIIERFNAQIAGQAPPLPPEKLSAYAVSIGDEAWRISELSERLVMLLSKKPGNIESCDLGRLVDRTLKRLKLRKRGRKFDAQIITNGESAPSALADPEQLQLLIAELLANAEFAAAHKPWPSNQAADTPIIVELAQDRNHSTITVSNYTGTHCPFALETLCDPFVTEFGDHKHIGIGLTMVLAIVRRFNGDIEFTELRDGDAFKFSARITLPSGDEQNMLE